MSKYDKLIAEAEECAQQSSTNVQATGIILRLVAALRECEPREARAIDGMTEEDIRHAMSSALVNDTRSRAPAGITDLGLCAEVAHRLANTPATPKPDPDDDARHLYETWWSAKTGYRHKIPPQHWLGMGDEDKNGWRAVAASMKEKSA